jgi:uncharacterized protein DUF6496
MKLNFFTMNKIVALSATLLVSNIVMGFESAPQYSKKAQEKVRRALGEMKRGELISGRSGKPVTSRKQAIAIGLSEARRTGAKIPKKRA